TDMGRRAVTVAMFGGHMTKGFADADGHFSKTADATHTDEAVDFHLDDHEASRLITQDGETSGFDVGHQEYMDMYYDQTKHQYHAWVLRKKDEIIEQIDPATGLKTPRTTGRKMWQSDGWQLKQAFEAAKRNPRVFMNNLS